jgi:transposase-like protein
MPRSGSRAVRKYSDEFKLTAVQLSQRPGLQVKNVAAALTIHPFMLSKWRKDVRDGRLGGRDSSGAGEAEAAHHGPRTLIHSPTARDRKSPVRR